MCFKSVDNTRLLSIRMLSRFLSNPMPGVKNSMQDNFFVDNFMFCELFAIEKRKNKGGWVVVFVSLSKRCLLVTVATGKK